MFVFLGLVLGSAVLISGVVAVAYTATKIKNDLDAANSAIADLEASTDIVTSNVRNKVKITSDGEKIIGLKDGSLVKAQSTLTTVDFDTTEYGDRAVLQLRNNTGSAITLTGLSIRGKPVKQLSGANGYVWEYSDYDDIEKNGENFVEVSNDFIFSPLQARSIGDFVWKELRPHKMYSLTLIGTQYQYEIGQIWHLTLSYSLDGHTMEDIDTDVEVMGVSLSRSVGGVGTTALSLRVPSSAWELTLAKNAKLVGAGNSQRLSNRSNIITVASSTWTGQADYFCDGTADDVEIQAAIDYIASIGGGQIILTGGYFSISATLALCNNLLFSGEGISTILNVVSNVLLIDCRSLVGVTITNMKMVGYSTRVASCIVGNASSNGIVCDSLYISNFSTGIYEVTNIKSCEIDNCKNGIYNVTLYGSCVSCIVSNCTSEGIRFNSVSSCVISGCDIGSRSNAITNSKIYSNNYGAIVEYRDSCSGNIINNNTTGIYIPPYSGACVVTSNKLYSNTTNINNSSATPSTIANNDIG